MISPKSWAEFYALDPDEQQVYGRIWRVGMDGHPLWVGDRVQIVRCELPNLIGKRGTVDSITWGKVFLRLDFPYDLNPVAEWSQDDFVVIPQSE